MNPEELAEMSPGERERYRRERGQGAGECIFCSLPFTHYAHHGVTPRWPVSLPEGMRNPRRGRRTRRRPNPEAKRLKPRLPSVDRRVMLHHANRRLAFLATLATVAGVALSLAVVFA